VTDAAGELHDAAGHGDLDRVAALLTTGADPNMFDEEGRTPLHHAVAREHLEVARLLLDRGADADACDESSAGNTPLREVAGTCSLAVARLLIDAGADPTIPGWMQITALDKAAARTRGDGPRVYRLLARVAPTRGVRRRP
jgi:ankyrin repeat protein